MKNEVRLLICAEGGQRIGFGHVRRCLSLATALREQGGEVCFLSNDDSAVTRQVTARGFQITRTRSEFSYSDVIEESSRQHSKIVVVDSYRFKTEDFQALMDAGRFVVALDDLAEIDLPVHVVINGSVGADQLAYQGLENTQFILGGQYILLRAEFERTPQRNPPADARRVLITVGGSDPHNLTPRLIDWVGTALPDVEVDVMVGPLFENKTEIEAARQGRPDRVLHFDPEDVRSLMLDADLAISGGGQTTYELAATGTPTIAVELSENQAINLKGLSESGALVWVGGVNDADLGSKLQDALSTLAGEPRRRAELGQKGRALVDGRGSFRTANAILNFAQSF